MIALEGDIFDMKSFAQLAITFFCGASSACLSVVVFDALMILTRHILRLMA